VLIGVNDLVQGRSADEYRRSLTTIYDAVSGRPVVAVSIPTWSYVPAAEQFGGPERVDRLTRVFNEVARDQAEGRGYTWVDLTEASSSGIGTVGWIAADDLHPGDAQYAAWAEAIWPAVERLVAPDRPDYPKKLPRR
jgi:lysophospholipase L1-like esterase